MLESTDTIIIVTYIYGEIKMEFSQARIDYYRKYRNNPKDVDSLQKVRELAVEVIEYKRNDKSIEQVFSSQVKGAIKETDQLQRTSKREYVIEPTKTNAGTRVIPMTNEVTEMFRAIIEDGIMSNVYVKK